MLANKKSKHEHIGQKHKAKKRLIERLRLFVNKKRELLQKAEDSGFSDEWLKMLNEAIDVARKSHLKQYRNNGDPYITHPLEVAIILMDEFGAKEESKIIAAVLHDSVEDSPKTTLENIRGQFGEDIASKVGALTKYDKDGRKLSPRAYADRIRNAPAEVRLIKAADALHNTRSTLARIEEGSVSRRELEKVKFYYHNYLQYIKTLPAEISDRFKEELQDIRKLVQDI